MIGWLLCKLGFHRWPDSWAMFDADPAALEQDDLGNRIYVYRCLRCKRAAGSCWTATWEDIERWVQNKDTL